MKYEKAFFTYMAEEKHLAGSSQEAYYKDVEEFLDFIAPIRQKAEDAQQTDVAAYLSKLKEDGKSAATVNRKLASIRTYYTFLKSSGHIRSNPAEGIHSPRIERKEIDYLSAEEMDSLLSAPDDSEKGLRDKAMLELMYATGIRANELTEIKVYDINLQIGFISIYGENGKTRMIPVGRPARAALKQYIKDVRPAYIAHAQTDKGTLFVNYMGEPLTRQGIWKILKYYGDKAGIQKQINPQIIRNTFAAHMVQNGADLKSLQELMGYEDIMATRLFAGLTKNRIMDVYDRAHPRA